MAEVPFGPKVPSLCVAICTIDDAVGLCRGCYRTMDEIADWQALTDEQKDAVWTKIYRRKKEHDL